MRSQHKCHIDTDNKGLESKKGERRRLCCNNVSSRSPFLEFKSNSPLVTEEMQLDYLASLIVAIFLEQKRYGKFNKEGSDLLPGINEGTS